MRLEAVDLMLVLLLAVEHALPVKALLKLDLGRRSHRLAFAKRRRRGEGVEIQPRHSARQSFSVVPARHRRCDGLGLDRR